jgi:hypothetical protein
MTTNQLDREAELILFGLVIDLLALFGFLVNLWRIL